VKRITILAFVALFMFSVVAFAGPYFTLENDGTVLAPTFTGGCDYSFAIQTEPSARMFLDAHWDAPVSDLTGSIGVGLNGFRVNLETVLDWNLPVNALNGWNTSLTLTGNVFTGLKVWGGMSFNYNAIVIAKTTTWPGGIITPRVPIGWTLVPVFGIEGRW